LVVVVANDIKCRHYSAIIKPLNNKAILNSNTNIITFLLLYVCVYI